MTRFYLTNTSEAIGGIVGTVEDQMSSKVTPANAGATLSATILASASVTNLFAWASSAEGENIHNSADWPLHTTSVFSIDISVGNSSVTHSATLRRINGSTGNRSGTQTYSGSAFSGTGIKTLSTWNASTLNADAARAATDWLAATVSGVNSNSMSSVTITVSVSDSDSYLDYSSLTPGGGTPPATTPLQRLRVVGQAVSRAAVY